VTSNINAASSSGVNVVGTNISIELSTYPNMPSLEDIGIFEDSHDDEDVFVAEANFYNLDSTFQVSPIPTTRIHKDHPLEQVIGDLHLVPQTRRMSKNLEEHGLVGTVIPRTNNTDLQNYLFACFISQLEPKKEKGIDYDEMFAPVARIEARRLFLAYASFKDFTVYQMDVKSAFLYGKIEEEVHVCQPLGFEDPDFPYKVYKVEKALYGLHQALRACQDKYVAEILKKFGFLDVKKASTPMESSKPLLKDKDGEEVDVHMYRSMIGSLIYLTSFTLDIMFAIRAYARYQVTPKVLHLHVVKRIFRYLKGQPNLGIWYPKDSPFDLVAYTDSVYAGASLDRKSTTRGCHFLGCRLISWWCKKQIMVANSTTEAEYVDASSCYGQVL
nr:putative reverse transcriptase, RNA-dependent DNA polymerase [Tanacetum cinerariifolium]